MIPVQKLSTQTQTEIQSCVYELHNVKYPDNIVLIRQKSYDG